MVPAEAAKLVRKGTVFWGLQRQVQLVYIKKVVDHVPVLYEIEMRHSHGAAQMARPRVNQYLLMEALITVTGRAEFLGAVEQRLSQRAEQLNETE